ncbi:MAG: sigma 54-interacting transcriptional regulator [Bdellovibrionales bacterium]|nr:sigma 54-interacting transcriptional regulator [Bdellovibrionales bacterium]
MLERDQATAELVTLHPSIASTWLIALRTAMVSVGLLASTVITFIFKPETAGTSEWIFTGFAFLFFVNGVLAAWSRSTPPTNRFLGLQLVFDCIVVSCILYISGGPHSPFVFLFLPFQMIAATFLMGRSSLLIGALSSGLYLLLCVIHELQPSPSGVEALTTARLFLQWFGVTLALFLIHRGTTKVRHSLLASLEKAQLSRMAAESLRKDFSLLIEGMAEAVIVIDERGIVSAVNRAAEKLFGESSHMLLGKNSEELSYHFQDRFGLEQSLSSYNTWDEVSLRGMTEGEAPRRVIFHRSKRGGEGNQGVATYLLFQDVTQLRSVEEQLALQERMARALAGEDESNEEAPSVKLAGFVGESPVMKKLFQLIDRVSSSDATVLIAGESGTGKELVAKALHLQSGRSQGPFIPVNCGAIPEQLLESELFGHKKGAFTDAVADHPGLFVQAIGGTIFLDEIGEMPLSMQAKLLRAIQEKTIRAVGGTENVHIDVRIIAATNRDLREEVMNGNFREDLYYRLNVIHMNLPPLRDRKEDIPLLIQSILKRLAHGSRIPMVPPQTVQCLMDYLYPGNVRELENILERALVMGGEAILPEHLPDTVRNPEPLPVSDATQIIIRDDVILPVQLDYILSTIEQQYLQMALQQSDGVKKRAAELLGMNFRSFRYRLQKFGLSESSQDDQ